jgi:hypothetical protein
VALGILKLSEDPTAPVRAQAAASSIPQVTVPTLPAAAGKKGPVGTSPRTNYSRVNTGVPMMPDAGATEQKSLSPKYGSIMLNGMKTAYTPTLQDMVKSAQSGALERSRIAAEAERQLANIGGGVTKTAEEMCDKCNKPMSDCTCDKMKKATVKVSTAYAIKAAESLEFLASEAKKTAAPNAPPPHLTERATGPGEGPGALEVSHATASQPLPDHKGQGHQQPPMKPGGEKVLKGEHGDTQMQTNMSPIHTSGKIPQQTVPKHASVEIYQKNLKKMFGKEAADKFLQSKVAAADLYKKNCERLGIKVAEDAIFPAHISAGKEVPPETSHAGQPGGAPAGGMPQGRKGTDSNQASIDITKGQAKSDPKSDLKKWFNEPALTSSTDSTLSAAFDNTGRAGTKFASAEKEGQADGRVKTAAARALLENLLESVKGNKAA